MGDLARHLVDIGDQRSVTVETGEYAPSDSERRSGEGCLLASEAALP